MINLISFFFTSHKCQVDNILEAPFKLLVVKALLLIFSHAVRPDGGQGGPCQANIGSRIKSSE